MGLQLKLNAEEERRSFILFDCTGDFSAQNPGGWGGPNPRIQDVTSSIVEVVGPIQPPAPNFDPVQAALDTPPGSEPFVVPDPAGKPISSLSPMYKKLDLTGNFPNMQDAGYEVLPNQIVTNQTKIISGKWTLRWTVKGLTLQGKPFMFQTMLIVMFTKDVTCCVDKEKKNLDKNAFMDKAAWQHDSKQRVIIELSTLLDSALDAVKKGLFDQADETIRYLAQQCTCVTC